MSASITTSDPERRVTARVADEFLESMSPERLGMFQAAELNVTRRLCTVSWCEGSCFWVADFIGGAVSRMHHRELSDGNSISQVEPPPGTPNDGDEWRPALYLNQQFDDGLVPAQVAKLVADLTHDLALMSDESEPTAAFLPVPSWAAGTDWHDDEIQHHRYAYRPLDVTAWLEQIDQPTIANGQVSIVREPATITISFELLGGEEPSSESEVLPVAVLRDGRWPTFSERVTLDKLELARSAVTELLAAYDGAR